MIYHVIVLFRRFTKQTRLVGRNKSLIDSELLNFIESLVIQTKDDQIFLGQEGQNHHCDISAFFSIFSIGMQKECCVSNDPCLMPLFSLMIFEVKSAGPPPIIV